MNIQLKVYDNGDHACLVWLPESLQPISKCLGFAIKRVKNGDTGYLHGFVGFSEKDTLDPKNPWKLPLQRYMWWDYDVKPGDKLQYSVAPVVGNDKDHMSIDDAQASPETPELVIRGQRTPHLSAYFNKGIVSAQWVSRALAAQPKGANIKDLITDPANTLRQELAGLLLPELKSRLEATRKKNGKICAALYELNDRELIAELVAFGQNCTLILANGAFRPPDNDENKQVRALLKSKIEVFDRLVSTGHFAHNKFVVFCDAQGKPESVLTGSTNWSFTGLCTQANNALFIDDPAVAQNFLDAWTRIHDAGNGYPSSLVNANSVSKSFNVDECKITPSFVATAKAQDLNYARKLINGAKQGILFLFFNPGVFEPDDQPEKWTLLQNILYRHHQDKNEYYDPNLYIKGVVNQEIASLTNDQAPASKASKGKLHAVAPTHAVNLYSDGVEPPQRLDQDVMIPANIKTDYSAWEKELLGAGVHVHSKVIVLDPFGDHPVVMTGSHNLGFKASSKNDDNLVIVEGNAPLAVAYAVNIIATFQTYRWNSHVEQHRNDPKFWHGLQEDDQWQAGHLQGPGLAELKFWLGEAAKAGSAAAASADRPASSDVSSASSDRHGHKVNAVSTHSRHGHESHQQHRTRRAS